MYRKKQVYFIYCCLSMVFVLLLAQCAHRSPVAYNKVMTDISDGYALKADKLAQEAQFASANFYLRKAIPIYKNAGNWLKTVECYIKLGDNHRDVDQFKKALEYLEEAKRLTLERLGHKPLALAKSYLKLAYKYFHQEKNYRKALDLYQQALDITVDILGEEHREVAKIYNSIALLYWNMGENKKATQNYNRSFSIKLRHLMAQAASIADEYRFLEKESFHEGTFHEAQESYRESLAQHLETYGPHNPLVSSIYENMGILYALEGRYDKAMENLHEALSIRSDAFGFESLKTASIYHNIGICLRLQGKYDEALRFFDDALAIKLKLLGRFHSDTADTYFQLGQVVQAREQCTKALGYFQDALAAMVPTFSYHDLYENPADIKSLASNRFLKVLSAKALALRQRYYVETGQVEDLLASMETYRLLAGLIDDLRSGFKSESYKLFFAEKYFDIYSKAVLTAMDIYKLTSDPKYQVEAFLFSERSKATVLADAVSASHALKFAGIPLYLLEKEKKLKEELTLYDTYFRQEKQDRVTPEGISIETIEDYYFMLKDDYQELIDYFEQNYPEYYNLKYHSRPLSIPALQQALGKDTALIEYFITGTNLCIFVLTNRQLFTFTRQLTTDLSDQLRGFYLAIKKIEEKNFLELGGDLYDILVAPIRESIQDKANWLIIPHGPLYYIPFEALFSPPALPTLSPGDFTNGNPSSIPQVTDFSRLDYLIKKVTIHYHYSANLWLSHHLNRNPLGGAAKENPRRKRFVGFAPVFSTGNNLAANGVHYPELPASEEELRSIIDLFKAAQQKAVGFFAEQAGESAFKSADMKNYDFIHIATHSLDENENPGQPGLIFSTPQKRGPFSGEDGILYPGEIYNLDLNARLVVLSSCESGIGKLVKGEGMIALARAFFYAGVENIIFSLWRVEDRTTSWLMIELYRAILAGESFPGALRKAKLAMIADRFTAFPRYWSAFLLVGE